MKICSNLPEYVEVVWFCSLARSLSTDLTYLPKTTRVTDVFKYKA